MTPRRAAAAAGAGALLVLVVGGGLVLASRDKPKGPFTANDHTSRASQLPPIGSRRPTDRIGGVQATLPSCSAGALHSASPIALDKLDYILPLGNFTPLPSDHLYFLIARESATAPNSPPQTVNVFAPGDITVFKIGRQVKTTNGTIVKTDYFLDFAACREVTGAFGHVTSFTGRLAAITFDNCDQPYTIGDGSEYVHCSANVDIPIRAGEQIGTAGGQSSFALDFASDDWRVPTPYVATPIISTISGQPALLTTTRATWPPASGRCSVTATARTSPRVAE